MDRRLFALLLAVLAVGCGGTSTPAVQSPVDVQAIERRGVQTAFDYLPAESSGYVRVGVRALREAPYFQLVLDLIEPIVTGELQTDDDRAKYEAIRALVDGVDRLYLGYVPGAGTNEDGEETTDIEKLIVLEGSHTLADYEALFRRFIDTPIERVEVAGNPALRSDEEDVFLVDLGGGRFITGDREKVTQAVLSPPASRFQEQPGYTFLRSIGEDESVLFVAVNGYEDGVSEGLRSEGIDDPVQRGALMFGLQDGLQLRFVGEFESEHGARALAA
ncbi:MAG: hypothetical protein AAF411_26860, partial [Myxococcota bacterium]